MSMLPVITSETTCSYKLPGTWSEQRRMTPNFHFFSSERLQEQKTSEPFVFAVASTLCRMSYSFSFSALKPIPTISLVHRLSFPRDPICDCLQYHSFQNRSWSSFILVALLSLEQRHTLCFFFFIFSTDLDLDHLQSPIITFSRRLT